MSLTRRDFLTSLPGLALTGAACRAEAQNRAGTSANAAPPDELVRLAGGCILAGSRMFGLHPILRTMLTRKALGGVLIAHENFSDAATLANLCRDVRNAMPPDEPPPLIAADQEGGTVSHLSPPLPWMPGIPTLGDLDDTDLSERWGQAMGTLLRRTGMNFNLAPVLDVRTNPRNMVVHGRTFGSRPELVARHGPPLIRGLTGAGVLACAKHFPGHGDTREDSHTMLPVVPHGLTRLDAVELVPFRAVATTVPAVMVAHVIYQGIDASRPATLSPTILRDVLRDRVGFGGVAVSDDLEMYAIRHYHGVPEGAVKALEAGCDLVIIAHTPVHARDAAVAMARKAARDSAFRTRLEEAAGRVRRMRAWLQTPLPPNPYAVDPVAVIRETQRRARERGQAPTRAADPTLQR
jgi:beta-N-acetylhexosaminidase